MMLMLTSLLILMLAGACDADGCMDELSDCKTVGKTKLVMANICGGFADWLVCLKDEASRSCQLKNSKGVTFSRLTEISDDHCPAISQHLTCRRLQYCIGTSGSKYDQVVNEDSAIEETVKTEFWCSLLLEVYECAIQEAADCGYDNTDLEENREDIKARCNSGTSQEGTLTTLLVLSTAALILPLIFA